MGVNEPLARETTVELRWRRSLLGQLAAILLVILAMLVGLYWLLTRPRSPAELPKATGISHIFTIFGIGRGDDLNRPDDATIDARGNIYVSDSGNHRVLVFDGKGRFIRKIGRNGTGKGKLKFPLGIAVDGAGRVYVSTMGLNKIMVFSQAGRFLREFRLGDDAVNDLPIKLRIKDNRLYATASGRVVVMDLNGKVLRKWGELGKGLGRFAYPNGLDVDADGKIFVSDSNNSRIQIFNQKGRLIGAKGKPPKNMRDAGRMFGLNLGLAIDEAGRVFVVDAFNSSIRVFDKDGEDLGELGQDGSHEGQLHVPSGLTHVAGDRFLVADKWNNRVQMVALTVPGQPAVDLKSFTAWPFWAALGLLLFMTARVVRRLLERRRMMSS